MEKKQFVLAYGSRRRRLLYGSAAIEGAGSGKEAGVAAGAGSKEITSSTSNMKQKANWEWGKAMNT